MIANIKYGNNVVGIVNYVYKKVDENQGEYIGGNILDNPSKKELIFFLNHQGLQKDHATPFAHISLSLSIQDKKVSDVFFKKLADEYLINMGYENQPYVIVKHTDTQHQHVHIISTTVTEEGKKIYLSNDRVRSLNISRKLEIKHKLQRVSSNTKNNISLVPNTSKHAISNNVNLILKKYKPRSISELQGLLKKHNIYLSITKAKTKKGILFHLTDDNGNKLNTKPIAGSNVDAKFSYSKLQYLVDKNKSSKLIINHKKRLQKQLNYSLNLFTSINRDDFKFIVEQQGISLEEHLTKDNNIQGYSINDTSGYCFKLSEINREFTISKKLSKIGEGLTSLDMQSERFNFLVEKIVKQSIQKSFKSSKERYMSKFLEDINLNKLVPSIKNNEIYDFISEFINSKEELDILIDTLNEKLQLSIDSIDDLRNKELLALKEKINKGFNVSSIVKEAINDKYIFESLGLHAREESQGTYICDIKSTHHVLKFKEKLKNSNQQDIINSKYQNSYIQNLNYETLKILMSDQPIVYDEIKISSDILYLPLHYPSIYLNLKTKYKEKYDELVQHLYIQNTLKKVGENLTTPDKLIEYFNYKGIEIIEKNNDFLLSIKFCDTKNAIKVPKNLVDFLKSDSSILNKLVEQKEILSNEAISNKKDFLEKLWLNSLLEKKQYSTAAFFIIKEKVDPFLSSEDLQEHLDNGLKQELNTLVNKEFTERMLNRIKTLLYSNSSYKNLDDDTDFFKQEMKGKKRKKKKRFRL